MAHALLLYALVTGALALLLSGLVTAQWLLARLPRVGSPSPDTQLGRLEVTTSS